MRARCAALAVLALIAALCVHAGGQSDDEGLCIPAAHVRTLAGAGVAGFRDSAFGGAAALLRSPLGVALHTDSSGIGGGSALLYIADAGNHRIRVLQLPARGGSDDGEEAPPSLRLLAGTGLAGAADGTPRSRLLASFDSPSDVAVTAEGDVLVAEEGNNGIRVVRSAASGGMVERFAGHGIDGLHDSSDPLVAQFNRPRGLVHDIITGHTYVADTGNNVIRKIDGAVNPETGTRHSVSTLVGSASGEAGFADSATGSDALFNAPTALALDAEGGRLFVADAGNNAVRVVDLQSGAVLSLVGDPDGTPLNLLLEPEGVAFDPARGLYVADTGHDRVVLVGTNASIVTNEGDGVAEGMGPYGVVRGVAGSLAGGEGLRDGSGTEARLSAPVGLAINAEGTVYVGDRQSHAVRQLELEDPVVLALTVTGVGSYDHDTGVDGANARPGRWQDQYEAGYYSINGPPHNETFHVADYIMYHGEEHEVRLCSYPSQSTFFFFKGAVSATVADERDGHVYLTWRGAHAWHERSETVRLRAPGCADEGAANYNPYATIHVPNMCIMGHRATLVVRASGEDGGAYQIEGPAFFHYDELAGLGEDMDEDETHELTLAYYPGAMYTFLLRGQVAASLHPPEGRWGEYLEWAGNASDDRALLNFRPPGPGCTDPTKANYNPLATVNDGSCISSTVVDVTVEATDTSEVGYQSSNTTASPPDWFQRGAFVATDAATGADMSLSHLFREVVDEEGEGDEDGEEAALTRRLRLVPGRYTVTFFGQVSGRAVDVESADELLTFDGALEATLYIDENGFVRTLEDGEALFRIGEDSAQTIDAGDATIIVPTDALEDGEVVDIDVEVVDFDDDEPREEGEDVLLPDGVTLAQGFEELGMYPIGQIFRFLPPGKRFLSPVTVQVPYDERSGLVGACGTVAGVPCDQALTFVRASDERADDWRVLSGGHFENGLATLRVDSLSLLAVVLRARVDSVVPLEGGSATGGATITVVGSQFRGGSYTFCRFTGGALPAQGLHAKAQVLSARRMACALPRAAQGFVTLEYMHARTLMLSNTSTTVLVHPPPRVRALAPRGGGTQGGTLVTLRGADLHAYATSASLGGHLHAACEIGPARSAAGGSGKAGGFRRSIARLVSSALATCETPDAALAGVQGGSFGAGGSPARVSLARGTAHLARERTFDYAQPGLEDAEMSMDTFMHARAEDGGGSVVDDGPVPGPGALLATREYWYEGAAGHGAKDVSTGDPSGGSSVAMAGDNTCSPMSGACRCTFGTLMVAALATGSGVGGYGRVECVAPGGAPGARVSVTVGAMSSGEAWTAVGEFTLDGRPPPRTLASGALEHAEGGAVVPAAGSAAGGGTIAVHVPLAVAAGEGLGCAFGRSGTVPAVRLALGFGGGGVWCAVPATPSGFLALRVVQTAAEGTRLLPGSRTALVVTQFAAVEPPRVLRSDAAAVRLAGGGGALGIAGANLRSPLLPRRCGFAVESGAAGYGAPDDAPMALRAVSSALAWCPLHGVDELMPWDAPTAELAVIVRSGMEGPEHEGAGSVVGEDNEAPVARVTFASAPSLEAFMGEATPSGLAPDGGAVLSLPPPPTGEAVKSLAALERPKAAELRCLVGTLSAATLSAGSGASICVAPARPPGRWPIALRAATGSLTAGEAIADGGHLQYADREVAGGVAIPEAVSAGVTSSITVAVPGVPQWRASAHLDCRVEAPGGVSAVTAANGNVCSLPAMSAGFGALTLASQADAGAGTNSVRAYVMVREAERVASVHPSRSPPRGGALVRLSGAHFHAAAAPACAFGSQPAASASRGVVLSSALLACEVPPAYVAGALVRSITGPPLAAVPVAVLSTHSPASGRAQGALSSAAMMTYGLEAVRRLAETPSMGASRGGTAVVLRGELGSWGGVGAAPGCAFGTVSVAARSANTTAAVCLSPTHSSGRVPLALTANAAMASVRLAAETTSFVFL